MTEPEQPIPTPTRTPRTLDDLLEIARSTTTGRRLSKTELSDFMSDLLALGEPGVDTVAVAPSADPMAELGFYDRLPPVFQVKPGNVFIPLSINGHHTPRQAAALSGALYRAALEAQRLEPVKNPGTDARLRALLPYKAPK